LVGPTEDANTLRLLVISDIHANLEALEACLDAAPEYDHVYNLGDIVGYGANPNEVTARSRELGSIFVRGNHDKACSGLTNLEDFNPIAGLAALWTREQLKPENLGFLHDLPAGPIAPLDGLQLVHGSPRDEDEYVLMPRDAFSILATAKSPITFFGHTHVQGGFWIDDEAESEGRVVPKYSSRTAKQQATLKLNQKASYMINPGSIGQPRDNDPRAAFLLYDTEENAITFYRVPYDIGRAQKKIISAGLPERLAMRLAEGR
jgi:diadenosine tetraphosphatase ApaH/serine/threonine PP2A family protein phosphatase